MPKLRLRRGLLERVTFSLLALGPAHLALADDDAIARAAILSREAEKLESDGKISEACAKYQQSQTLDPRASTLLDEAICREKEGKTGTAFNLFVQAEKASREEKQADRAATAVQHQRALAPKLARVTVSVPKDAVVDGLEIDAGVQIVPRDQWGKAYPVDTGALTITASAPAKETWTTTVTVGPGSKQTVTIPVLKPGAGPAPKPVPEPDQPIKPTAPTQGGGQGTPTQPVKPPEPPRTPIGHQAKRVVADIEFLAGVHISDVRSGPNSRIDGTQYSYLGEGGTEYLASCGLTSAVAGAGSCKTLYKPQIALMTGADVFVGYAVSETVELGVRASGGFQYPFGFWVLGGPSLSARVKGPFWMGLTGLVGTSQVQATVTGAKGSVPDKYQVTNGGSTITIGNQALAGGLAGGDQVSNAWATIEAGGSLELSIMLSDNVYSPTGGVMLSAWPYAVWSPGGPAFGVPLGIGYRFY